MVTCLLACLFFLLQLFSPDLVFPFYAFLVYYFIWLLQEKNNNSILVSYLIFALLCKIKQLCLGDEYGGGVAVIAIQTL